MDKRVVSQFIFLTFCLAYSMSIILIILGQFGFSVQSSIPSTFQSISNFLSNIPFLIYILSPAIASFIVLRKNNKITNFKEWLKTVFYVKNNVFLYLFVIGVLALYFFIHIGVSGYVGVVLPFYMFFLNLPGNLIIGGLEESGWVYILQSSFYKKYGFILSSIYVGFIWLLWHVPLFFIPGTSHNDDLINFWLFAMQIMAFRFIYGAIYRISGKGYVFMCVLFHTMFNAGSHVFGILPMTLKGSIIANIVIIIISIITVVVYNKKKQNVKRLL